MTQIKQHRADEVKHRQYAFGGKEPVGEQADKEGRDHTGKCGRAEHRASFRARELQRGGEVGYYGHVPRAPDDIIQKHHEAEAHSNG